MYGAAEHGFGEALSQVDNMSNIERNYRYMEGFAGGLGAVPCMT